MEFRLSEHTRTVAYPHTVSMDSQEDHAHQYLLFSSITPRVFRKKKGKSLLCFQQDSKNGLVTLEANYYIGLDWLITGHSVVQVLPKVNTSVLGAFVRQLEQPDPSLENDEENQKPNAGHLFRELNYLRMFMDAMAHPVIAGKLDGLLLIDWDAPRISIDQKHDMLTPFLIVHFLTLVRNIARKGLKKSYYRIRRQLRSRVKGKIVVGEHIRRNVMKHRLTDTFCEYQEFGVDSIENRFLKKVLDFVGQYLATHTEVFKGMEDAMLQMMNFCSPVFQQVSPLDDDRELRHIRTNPFFKEYGEAMKIGDYILRRFAYNISASDDQHIPTPPFWIDMPQLFELYTYKYLLDVFDVQDVEYHHSTYGNELDFLIKKHDCRMVIDAKYKTHYKAGHIHADIRQVSGYARLKTVYEALEIDDPKELIDCLIIYPSMETRVEDFDMAATLKNKSKISAYQGVYKVGIPMPWIDD